MPSSSPQQPAGPPARAEAIFCSALDQPPEARAAFIERACTGEEELQARVCRLFSAHERAGGFMDEAEPSSPWMETKVTPPAELPGAMIGNYKLREEIGEGGFGTVWVADQEQPVRRSVALKIIKLGMDTKEVIARFEQERQALAMMDHPNIAKVLDAGATDRGRPYFVMELVRGVTITDYCDDKHLSTRERIELFITVCQAVQHAHQKGIIHRDLKPSNILVTVNDGKAVPKVIDFGVAKATQGRLTDGTIYTQFQQMVGTPIYMSPEQAELTSLDVDTRSDIYALGVLLYELLTGHTPIEKDTLARVGMDEIRRLIREIDPPRPSMRMKTLDGAEMTTAAKRRHTEPAKLSGALRGDIDWIVMKCIEKDRARRYDTANGLAMDLQRHLANEVVVARPPTTAYLLSKLIRRNKLAFAAGTGIAASLVVGITASLWQAKRAENEATRAKAAEQGSAAALEELRQSAPAFAAQARSLAAKEQFAEAIDKLDYALKLRPDAAEYLLAKADLLQCQLKLAEAAEIYRDALRIQPGLARAEASAKLCDELLAAEPGEQGKLTRESLARLYLAMLQQQRPTSHLMPVARLVGEEKKLIVEYWLARLKELPISAEISLKDRLTVRDDGLLALDLSGTKIAELTPLVGMPLGTLRLSGCTEIKDFAPLHELRSLTSLNLTLTEITDLSPLKGLPLETFGFNNTKVFDLTALRGMKLKSLSLHDTRVSDLSPLAGMPLTSFSAMAIPATDYSPLAGAPLEKCDIRGSPLRDLSFLRDSPVKTLILLGCPEARGYAVLSTLKSLDLLILPNGWRNLPEEELAAIDALHAHPTLRNIDSGDMRSGMWWLNSARSKDDFWKAWDAERAFTATLRKSGFKYALNRLGNGTYQLEIRDQPLSDLSFLKGAPITELILFGTAITDLRPLEGLALTYLDIRKNPVTDLAPLRDPVLSASLRRLELWQIPATDFSPVSACRNLEYFDAADTALADLGVVRGLKLKVALLTRCKVTDIAVFSGMPLERVTLVGTSVTDISPLLKCPTLNTLTLPANAADVKALRSLPSLTRLSLNEIPGGHSDQSATDFWMQYEHDDRAAVLLPPSSEWKWCHPLDGVDPAQGDADFHTTFASAEFDDTAWQTGRDSDGPEGGFGYGEDWFTGVDIGTPSAKELGHSAYFRTRFTTGREHKHLELHCQRDDGIIIYIDGKEVARDNMSDGPESYQLPAARAVSDGEERTTRRIPLNDLTLPAGEHVLAISLHNTERPSSDLRIAGISLVEVEAE